MDEVFDVAKIQNKEPGWEEEWKKILLALLVGEPSNEDYGNIYYNGRLFRACRKAIIRVLGKTDNSHVEPFFNFVQDEYGRKIDNSKLFTSFDPERGTVINYLCSVTYLQKMYLRFSETVNFWTIDQVPLERETDDEDWATEDIEDRSRCSPEEVYFQRKRLEFLESLKALIIAPPPKKGSRQRLYAGLQLYPRLSKENAEMVALGKEVCEEVATKQDTTEELAESKIQESHDDADKFWEDKVNETGGQYQRMHQQAWETTKDFHARRVECHERYAKEAFNYLFAPLKSEAICELLHLTPNNAHQCLKRFKAEKKTILGKYYSYYAEFVEDEINEEEYDD